MDSNGFMSCQLRVDTQSAGWHKTITKILSAIKGVSYWIDVERGVAHVSGNTDIETLLKTLSKAGKHAELLRFESAAAAFSPGYNGHGPAPPPPPLPATANYSYSYPSFHNNTYDHYHHHRHHNYPPEILEPSAPEFYPLSSYLHTPPPPSPSPPTKLHRASTCAIV